jgi:thiol-disulfide isomerase/thioredoxin
MKLLLLLCCMPFFSVAQKINYTIDVEFSLVKPCKNIFVYYRDEQKMDTLAFSSKLHLTGSLSRAGLIGFRLDSFAYIPVWVDEGNIKLQCEETARRSVTITSIEGPPDTKLYYNLGIPWQVKYDFAPGTPPQTRDSIARAGLRNYSVQFIDSLIRVRPHSGVIPFYIISYRNSLGQGTVAEMFYRLPPDVRESDGGRQILNYLDNSAVLAIGTRVQDFELPGADGKLHKLSEITNKYILLDFWASWCKPCRMANPGIVRTYQEFNGKNFTVISISLDENRGDWLNAIQKDKLTWLNLSDLKGWRSALAEKYKIKSIPYSILLDENRNIIATNLYEEALMKLLADKLGTH